MKKSGDERFEQDLLRALRGPVRAAERNAARSRVAQRLQSTLAHVEVGAAAALPLLLEAPTAAATHSAASAGASTKLAAAASAGIKGAAAASGAGAASAGAAAAATHSLGTLLTAFALGAGAGGSALAVLSAGNAFDRSTKTSVQVPVASPSAAVRAGSPRQKEPASEPVGAHLNSSSNSTAESAQPLPVAPMAARPRVAANNAAPVRVGPGLTAPALSATPRETDTLTVQQGLLDRARAELARGNGGQALAALSEHARVHPSSELAEEREALTIKSLLAAGDQAAARQRAAGFASRYPRSLFLPSIRAALSEKP